VHALLIVCSRAHDGDTECQESVLEGSRDSVREMNSTTAVKELRPSGNSEAVVTRAGTNKGKLAAPGLNFFRKQTLGLNVRLIFFAPSRKQNCRHGINAAQRLEGAHPEAIGFIFDQELVASRRLNFTKRSRLVHRALSYQSQSALKIENSWPVHEPSLLEKAKTDDCSNFQTKVIVKLSTGAAPTVTRRLPSLLIFQGTHQHM
jgi:hypothetical protein